MPVNDDLGKRMKEYYEQIPKTKLMRRTPVIIRIDGKAFHTFTKGFKRPFDEVLIKTMQETTKYLCENIQGCVLGYTQSDEITLVLVDYKKFETSAWFDYEVQKMCSIAASMATMAFNRIFQETIDLVFDEEVERRGLRKGTSFKDYSEGFDRLEEEFSIYYEKANKAMFDARVFNIPKEEVTNCIYWRQLDASRNSIQMVGQANFSHKELQNKSCSEIQDMLMLQKGINWNDLPTYQKRGSCVIKEPNFTQTSTIITPQPFGEPRIIAETQIHRSRWFIDKEIPIFKGEGREYIEKLINVGE